MDIEGNCHSLICDTNPRFVSRDWCYEGYKSAQVVQNLRLGLTYDMGGYQSEKLVQNLRLGLTNMKLNANSQLWHSVNHTVLWIYHVNVNGYLDTCTVFHTLSYLWPAVIFVIWLRRVILKIFWCVHKCMDIVKYQFICFTDNMVRWSWDVKHATHIVKMHFISQFLWKRKLLIIWIHGIKLYHIKKCVSFL